MCCRLQFTRFGKQWLPQQQLNKLSIQTAILLVVKINRDVCSYHCTTVSRQGAAIFSVHLIWTSTVSLSLPETFSLLFRIPAVSSSGATFLVLQWSFSHHSWYWWLKHCGLSVGLRSTVTLRLLCALLSGCSHFWIEGPSCTSRGTNQPKCRGSSFMLCCVATVYLGLRASFTSPKTSATPCQEAVVCMLRFHCNICRKKSSEWQNMLIWHHFRL